MKVTDVIRLMKIKINGWRRNMIIFLMISNICPFNWSVFKRLWSDNSKFNMENLPLIKIKPN
jgi:hypothetical protein